MIRLRFKESPWISVNCINLFVEHNIDAFTEWCNERGIPKERWPDKELEYCEDHVSAFLEFSERYFESLIEEEADRKNDWDKLDSD